MVGDNFWLHLERMEPDFLQQGEMELYVTGRPFAQKADVTTGPYPFSPTDGKVDLQSYRKPAITDSAIAAITAITRVVDDPAIDPTAIEPARVKLTLKNGNVVELKRDTIKGSPQDPMNDAEMRGKVRGCLEFGIGATAADVDRLADVVASLQTSGDAAKSIREAFPQTK